MEELLLKIDELTKKVEFLENQEKKRIKNKNFKTVLKILKIAIIVGIILFIGIKINNKIVKPTREKLDFVEEKIKVVDEKVDGVGEFLKDKVDTLKNINPFKKD